MTIIRSVRQSVGPNESKAVNSILLDPHKRRKAAANAQSCTRPNPLGIVAAVPLGAGRFCWRLEDAERPPFHVCRSQQSVRNDQFLCRSFTLAGREKAPAARPGPRVRICIVAQLLYRSRSRLRMARMPRTRAPRMAAPAVGASRRATPTITMTIQIAKPSVRSGGAHDKPPKRMMVLVETR